MLVLFSVIMLCCTVNKTKEREGENRTLITNNYNKDYDPFQIIDTLSYRYIPLETNDRSSFGTINKVIIEDNLIFVLDIEFAKKALIFDIEGKFVGELGQKGKGPNEYILLQDLDIDRVNKQVILFDVKGRKLLYYKYNGEFIKKVQLQDYPGMTFSSISPEKIAFYLHLPVKKNNQLLIYSQNGKLVSQHFPFVNKDITYVMPEYFSKVDNNIFFIPIFYDKIFKIDKDANISQVFDFQIADLMVNDKDKRIYKTSAKLFKLKKFMDFENLVVNNNNQFICQNNFNNSVFQIVGNLDSKKMKVGYLKFNYKNMPSGAIASYNDYFVATFHPYLRALRKRYPNSKMEDNNGILLYKLLDID